MRAAILFVLAAACASTPPPPTLPPPTDIDSLLVPRPPLPDIPAGLPDGADRSVGPGQCKGLPAGLWVSERRFAERIAAVAERDRLRTEVGAYKKLRIVERNTAEQLEQAYRVRVGQADRRAEWRLWLGVAVGAGVVLAGAWAVGQVGR